jgi:hypothetical protein
MRRRASPEMSAAFFSRRAALLGLTSLAACNVQTPIVSEAVGGQIMQSSCVPVALPAGGFGWLTRVDLQQTAIDHIALEARGRPPLVGQYYPDSPSPAFERLEAAAVLKDYQAAHGVKAQGLINGSFFERYDPVTELSFPIKHADAVLTGGSSPYGPCQNPADARYARVKLKAFIWNDETAQIIDYDHTIGQPLSDPTFPNGLVTYDYRDHPANILMGDPVDQYQLLGLAGTIVLILTIGQGRMIDGAAVLQAEGAHGAILTLDGGPSTHLWHGDSGLVLETISKSLPHFLGFRLR